VTPTELTTITFDVYFCFEPRQGRNKWQQLMGQRLLMPNCDNISTTSRNVCASRRQQQQQQKLYRKLKGVVIYVVVVFFLKG
jgi:hypothetical protein